MHRSGTDEELTEKKTLLQEIQDLMEAGVEIREQKRKEKKRQEDEEKKKKRLLKKGKDIRMRAMQGLKGLRHP